MTSRDVATTAVIIVAAGRGERFGGPKHAATIDGHSLWERSAAAFASLDLSVTIVGDVPGGIPGGTRRRDSVASGLATLGDVEWVLIHDAARPLVSRALILSVLERLHVGDVDAVIPAMPVSDTVKKVSGDRIINTLDRASLVTVQTPQGFRRDVLVEAHRVDPHEDVTDDAGLVERLGGTVVTVPGEATNLKVTYPEDLERARAIAAVADRRG